MKRAPLIARRPLLCAMSQTGLRPVILGLALLASCALPVGVAARNAGIAVRIYDSGAGNSSIRATALRHAASIVADAGMSMEWWDCTGSPARHRCTDRSRREDLIVRILPAAAGRSEDDDFQLGIAVIDPRTRAGAMASVFQDRVRSAASRARVDYATLLGRVLAHEVGHLLLREVGHSRTGLMRAIWSDAELTGNRREDWMFAPAQRRLLQLGGLGSAEIDLAQ